MAPPCSPVPPGRPGLTLRRGLGLKIGVIVLTVELLMFALVAFCQHASLSRSRDAAFLERIQTVSALMGRGLLSYESLGNPAYLEPLLGEEPILTLVLGANGFIFNALPSHLVGQKFQGIPGVDPSWLAEARHGPIIHPITEDGELRLACLAPLYSAMDNTPFLYVFFKLRTVNGQEQKRQLALPLLYAAGLGVVITSCLLLLTFHRMLFLPIRKTLAALQRLEGGDLQARVAGPLRHDQLGSLQAGLNAMAQSLEHTVACLTQEIAQRRQAEEQLRQGNETLEQRVEARTRELQNVNARLSREAAVRLHTELALQEANRQLQGVLDNSPTAIFLVDNTLRLRLHNCRFTELYGPALPLTPEATLFTLFPPEIATVLAQAQEEVRTSGRPMTVEETIPHGEGFTTLMTTRFPMRDERGVIWAVCSIATDITTNKRLEAEAIRAGQLANIGELAAGVAHEINNPIMGIINYSELLLDEAEGDAREVLARIITQAERVAAIVRTLLSYARADMEPFGPVTVVELIEDALFLIRYHLVKSGARVEVQVASGLPMVRGRQRELQQVLLNLLSNAQHALREQQLRRPDAGLYCTVRALLREDGRVALQVEDTGPGIPAEILPKITLPFFTTKPRGQGTGLGLSISRTIVDAHQGELLFENCAGGGLLAQVLLPVWQEP